MSWEILDQLIRHFMSQDVTSFLKIQQTISIVRFCGWALLLSTTTGIKAKLWLTNPMCLYEVLQVKFWEPCDLLIWRGEIWILVPTWRQDCWDIVNSLESFCKSSHFKRRFFRIMTQDPRLVVSHHFVRKDSKSSLRLGHTTFNFYCRWDLLEPQHFQDPICAFFK